MFGRVLILAPLAASLLLLPACGDPAPPPARAERERPAASDEPRESLGEETPAEAEEGQRYSYNSIGKRDPFRSFIQKEIVVVGEGGPLGPLQLHEIDAYVLRGIIWNVAAPTALVEDPDGIGHVVDLGTLIGKNWGKVTQIRPEELIITEEYRDPIENELIINEITMRLPDPAEDEAR